MADLPRAADRARERRPGMLVGRRLRGRRGAARLLAVLFRHERHRTTPRMHLCAV